MAGRLAVAAALFWIGCSPSVKNAAIQLPASSPAGEIGVAATYEVNGDPSSVRFAWTAEGDGSCMPTFADSAREVTSLHLPPGCAGHTVRVRLAIGAGSQQSVLRAAVQVKASAAGIQAGPASPATEAGHLKLRFQSARLLGIGEFAKYCEVTGEGALQMTVRSRQGDFAGCCAGLEPAVALGPRKVARLKVRLTRPEQVLHVKLERGPIGPNAPQAFLVSDGVSAGEHGFEKVLDNDPVGDRVERLCVAVVGPGPQENVIGVSEVTFE